MRKETAAAVSEETRVASPDAETFEKTWAELTAAEREVFESLAVAEAPAFLQRQYHGGKELQGTLWRVTRQRILVPYFQSAQIQPT